MTAAVQLSAVQARSSGLTSTSERHASPFVPAQPAGYGPRRPCSTSGAARLLPPRAVGYDGRQAPPAPVSARPYGVTPGSLVNRVQPNLAPSSQPPSPPGSPQQLPPGLLAGEAAAARQQALAAAAAAQAAAQQQAPRQRGPPPAAADAAGMALTEEQLTELERKRRQKISQANKGRVPWNKGRKHPPEVIARIRAATLQAMQRPDVKARLAKANEKREPHTDEAKAKIRVKLLQRADQAREEITEQAQQIVTKLQQSEDPVWRMCGEYEQAVDVVSGLAWQYFKKNWQDVATRGWEQHPEFRERCIKKLTGLIEKKRNVGMPRKRKVDKVKAALGHMKKLQEAQAKLAAAEEAVNKLQRAKVAFAGDPVRLRAAALAEEKASAILAKLRQQVAKLEEALQPLQQYVDDADSLQAGSTDSTADDDSANSSGTASETSSEQQQPGGCGSGGNAPEQQQWEQQQAAAAAGAAADPAAAAPTAAAVNGHAPLNGLTNGHVNGHVNGAVNGGEQMGGRVHVNGSASSMPRPPTAATIPTPPRRQMPWQQ